MNGICRDYWKHTHDQSVIVEKHQESTYHKIVVQKLLIRQQERSVAQ